MKFRETYLFILFFLMANAQDTLVNPFDLFYGKKGNYIINPKPYLWNEINTLQNSFLYELGQLGKPYLRFYYDVPTTILFNNYYQDFFTRNENVYWWKPEQAIFWDTKKPLSYVCFNQSSRKTQILDAIFTQSFNETFNIFFRYKRRTAEGAYLRSTTDHYNLSAGFYKKILRNRITFGTIWTFNQQVDELNGGADSISLQKGEFFAKNAQPIAINAAKLLRKGNYVMFPLAIKPVDNLQINYYFKYLWFDKRFSDNEVIPVPTSEYHPYYIYKGITDTIKTLNLFYYLNQETHNSNIQFKLWKLNTTLGASYEKQYFNSNYFDKNNTILSANYNITLKDSGYYFNSTGKYRKYSLFKEPEILVKGSAGVPIKSLLAEIFGEYHKRTPLPLVLTNSPFININTDSSYSEVLIAGLKFNYKNNVIITPYYSAIKVNNIIRDRYGVQITTRNKFWKILLENNVFLRIKAPDNLPDFNGKTNIYFIDSIFHSALLSVGLEGNYFTSYTAYYFNPVNQVSYAPPFLMKTKPYVRVDLVAKLNIKRFNGFIRIVHLNEGLLSDGYFLIAGYPMWERSFNFGIEWFLFD